MNCRKASELLSAAQEGELSRGERWGLRVHLVLCGACRGFRDSLSLLKQALQAAPPKTLAAVFAATGRLSTKRSDQIKALLREASRG
jgi:predicted anti-sigma-YlaC factor YlaD